MPSLRRRPRLDAKREVQGNSAGDPRIRKGHLEITVTNSYFLHARMLYAADLPELGKVFYVARGAA
jgi:hypothetical protein